MVTCAARRKNRVTAQFEFYQMRNEISDSTNNNTYEGLDNINREEQKGQKVNTKEDEIELITEFAE